MNFQSFKKGVIDGIPITIGYFVVSFSLGISAKTASLTALQTAFSSTFILASAGQFAAYQVIAQKGTIWSMVLIALVANARYFLQSFALNQHLDPKLSLSKRMLAAFFVTDEIFALSIQQPLFTPVTYILGLGVPSVSAWVIGSFLGNHMGEIFPMSLISALSVALFGMFIAVIIPATKGNPLMTQLLLVTFLLSYLASKWTFLAQLTDSLRAIILTIMISMAIAIIKPIKVKEVSQDD